MNRLLAALACLAAGLAGYALGRRATEQEVRVLQISLASIESTMRHLDGLSGQLHIYAPDVTADDDLEA